jgi:hypothetical protein
MNYLFSAAYLPPVEYFIYLLKAETIFLDKYENYIKQTYRNRCYIYGPNGKQALSIPVSKPFGDKTPVKDIRISYLQRWQSIHWRSIEAAYNSSPYFLYYKDEIYRFYNEKIDLLIDFNSELTKILMRLICIKKDIHFTTNYQQSHDGLTDLRNKISPKTDEISTFPEYTQVFSNKHGFLSNLSIIDLLFNEGPSTIDYLSKCEIS